MASLLFWLKPARIMPRYAPGGIVFRADALRDSIPEGVVVVSPDAGRVKMATEFANHLRAPLAVLLKRRESGTKTQVSHLLGDVRGRPCLIVDDMISTGGTLVESVRALREAGARGEFIVVATHGLLLGGAREKLAREGVGDILVTDTVPVRGEERPGLRVASVAPLIAAAVRRLRSHASHGDPEGRPVEPQ